QRRGERGGPRVQHPPRRRGTGARLGGREPARGAVQPGALQRRRGPGRRRGARRYLRGPTARPRDLRAGSDRHGRRRRRRGLHPLRPGLPPRPARTAHRPRPHRGGLHRPARPPRQPDLRAAAALPARGEPHPNQLPAHPRAAGHLRVPHRDDRPYRGLRRRRRPAGAATGELLDPLPRLLAAGHRPAARGRGAPGGDPRQRRCRDPGRRPLRAVAGRYDEPRRRPPGLREGSENMTRLFLVRHGQTTSNEIHALDTALPGASLTTLGREQAGAAGRYLRNASDRVHVLSSQAARAQQTAAGLATAFAAEGGAIAAAAPGSSFAEGFQRFRGRELAGLVDTAAVELAGEHAGSLASVVGVAEIPAGDMEMKNDEDSHELYHRLLGDWLHGQIDKVVPGGSSGAQVLTSYLPQALAVVAAAQAEGADAVLVSHGAVIRLVATWLGAVDPEFAYRAYLPNGKVVSIALPEDFGELL